MGNITHKKYKDIEHFRKEMIGDFSVGDDIVIQEKIDGSNASFIYDEASDSIIAFSRNYMLNKSSTLRGFWNWTQQLDKDLVRNILGTKFKVFGEWLTQHTVVYPEDKYQHFYCFDVWDNVNHRYLNQDEAMKIADCLGLTYVPVFYTGKFTKWSEFNHLIGKTAMGGAEGEGIVVKNMSNSKYTKIVSEKFRESHAPKPRQLTEKQIEKQNQMSEDTRIAMTIVTRARIEKILHKMVDDGIIPENWGTKETGIIMKNLGKLIYEDCLKEEPEIVAQAENFGKASNKIIGSELRKIMIDKLM